MDNNNDNLKNNNSENSKMPSQRKTLNVGLLDTTELATAQARDIAKAKMTKPLEEKDKTLWDKTLVTKFVKNIWRNNIAQGYYEQREFNDANKAILESGDLYVGEKDFEKTNNNTKVDTKLATKNGLNAVINRFLSQYEDEQLSENEKSTKEVNKNLEINGRLSDLVKSYAGGTMNEKDFIANQNKIFFDYDNEYAEKGKMYATNLLEIARNVKDSYIHGKDLANLDFDLNFTYGKAGQSLKTEAKLNSFEKAMSLMQKNKIGRIFVNEPVAVAVAAGIYSGVTNTGAMVAKSKLSQWATFGASSLLAGAVFGAKESFRVGEERAQHAREKAKGMTFEGKRREEMEKLAYETKSAKDIIATLDRDIEMLRKNKGREMGEILADLADLEARRKIGDEKKIDLIGYSDFAHLEQERKDIGEKIGEMKVLLRKNFSSSDPVKFQRDFEAEYVDNAKNRLIYGDKNENGENLKNGIEARDKAFKSMKRWRVASAVVKGTFVSATLGFVAQEVGSFFQDKTDGIVEGSIKKLTDNGKYLDTHTTALEGLRRYINHENINIPFGHGHEQIIGNAHVDLPQDVNLVQMPNGTYFADYNGDAIAHHIPEIKFNPDGTLAKECKDFFDHNNIVVDQYATMGSVEHVVSQNPHEFIAEHSDRMKEVLYQRHYDNDTKVFDKDELKLWWGGEHNTGVNENGDIVFNVKHMFNGGSFHGNTSVNPEELIKDGKMKILLSMTKDSDNNVFKINVDKFGNAIIPHDIPKELFSIENGHAAFHGHAVRAAHVLSENATGAENVGVLATYLGENDISSIGKTIPGDVIPHIKLTFPTNWDYEVPVVFPAIPRNPLERGSYANPPKNNSISPERTTQTETNFKVNENVQKEPIVTPGPKNKEDHERFMPKQQDIEEVKHKTESNPDIFTEEEMKRRRELFGRYS